ncbi:MAG: hypothetical protein JRI25_15685, partial [Deltaproteobacteria bacterium]|nr:hypothetical protein [Deltaproteobacteria bacterium]
YIVEEYGTGDNATGKPGEAGKSTTTDQTMENILLSQLETGEADERDLMNMGVDTAGTREVFVKEALDQIANEKDINVRLQKLDNLGKTCWDFIRREQTGDPNHPRYRRMQRHIDRADKAMAKMPPYVKEKTPELERSAGGIIHHIEGVLIVLDWEGDGGEQFDWELIVCKAWQYAETQFLSMLDKDDADTDDQAVKDFANESEEDLLKRIDEEWEKVRKKELKADEKGEERDLSPKQVLIAHYKKAEKTYMDGMNEWFNASTGWLLNDGNTNEPSKDTKKKWEQFKLICDRVEFAKTDLNDSNKRLTNAILAVVNIIAGIAIAIVSLGTATAATAALICMSIALVAGVTTMVVKAAINGKRYGAEEWGLDVAKMIADIAITALTMGLGSFKGLTKILDNVVKDSHVFVKIMMEAVKTLPGTIKDILFNEKYWDEGNWDQMGIDLVLGMVVAMAGGTVSEGVGATGVPKRVQRIMDDLLGAVTGVLADPRKWEDPNLGWDLLKALGTAALARGIGEGILQAQFTRLKDMGDLPDSEWERMSEIKGEVAEWFLSKLGDQAKSAGAREHVPEVARKVLVDKYGEDWVVANWDTPSATSTTGGAETSATPSGDGEDSDATPGPKTDGPDSDAPPGPKTDGPDSDATPGPKTDGPDASASGPVARKPTGSRASTSDSDSSGSSTSKDYPDVTHERRYFATNNLARSLAAAEGVAEGYQHHHWEQAQAKIHSDTEVAAYFLALNDGHQQHKDHYYYEAEKEIIHGHQ